MPRTIEVVISVTDDLVDVSVNPVVLAMSRAQEVCWRSYQGTSKVSFDGDSPFEARELSAPKGGGVSSGVPRRDRVRKDAYRYTVEVMVGERTCRSEEFEIFVDP